MLILQNHSSTGFFNFFLHTFNEFTIRASQIKLSTHLSIVKLTSSTPKQHGTQTYISLHQTPIFYVQL